MKSKKIDEVETSKIINLINQEGCFDLQFRKDVKRKRINSPTYYRWKAQFVVTNSKENIKLLEKIKEELKCGKIYITGNQARYCVQSISEIKNQVIPYFIRNSLEGKKKKDFELWKKAVEIIYKNKGKPLSLWQKNELASLLEIQKLSLQYKSRQRQAKWLNIAKDLVKIA